MKSQRQQSVCSRHRTFAVSGFTGGHAVTGRGRHTPKLTHSVPRGAAEGGSHPHPETAPQAPNLAPRRATRTRPGVGPARYPAATSGVANADAFAAPRMMIEAEFAASCNAFDDKWL